MKDQGLTPDVGVVVGTGMQGAAMVEDHRAGGDGAGDCRRQPQVTGLRHVVHGALRVVVDREDAVLVGARHVLHAAVRFRRFIEGQPGGAF